MLGRMKDKESEYWNDTAKKKSHVERQKCLPREEEETKEGRKGKQNKISMKEGGKYSSWLLRCLLYLYMQANYRGRFDRIVCCFSRAQFKRNSNYIYREIFLYGNVTGLDFFPFSP